jgi:uncharacterized glyoxalase superfamily metalloenzyme YdcJ
MIMKRTHVSTTELRARFAAALSELYGREVPAYKTLVEVAHEVNDRVLERDGEAAERLGSIDRVTAERHGAIRVGTPGELSQVARIFAALGMRPCGFYDLRDAHPRPIPVVSTAFRPLDRDELAANPFRVFTSVLVPEDRRFFNADLQTRLNNFLAERVLFSEGLLAMADRAVENNGLDAKDAAWFLRSAVTSFALSSEPVDRAWYTELAAVSDVAADIGGVRSTHINHLTPRVLDIEDLYTSMQARGIAMIDEIQGPPNWGGPEMLLRQTSFRALAEKRPFRNADGSVADDFLRVRFGEVEARGVAPTEKGRDLYEQMTAEVAARVESVRSPGFLGQAQALARQDIAARIWRENLPVDEAGLHAQGLAYFTYELASDELSLDLVESALRGDLSALIAGGAVRIQPIAYEDFLPRSAAGIFASNLTGQGTVEATREVAPRDIDWMSDVIGREISQPEISYAEESARSLADVTHALSARLGKPVQLRPLA